MRSIKSWLLASLFITVVATPMAAIAEANTAQSAAPPAKLENLDPAEAPAAAIGAPTGAQKISQKRQQSQVSEVEVQSGRSTYYLKPNQQAGSAVAGDAQGSTMRAPQWKILEFNLGGSSDKKEADSAPAAVPPPPAAPAPANK